MLYSLSLKYCASIIKFLLYLILYCLSQGDLKIKPVTNNVPPPVLPATIAPGDWAMKNPERMKYEQLFESLEPVGGKIQGNKVKVLHLLSFVRLMYFITYVLNQMLTVFCSLYIFPGKGCANGIKASLRHFGKNLGSC